MDKLVSPGVLKVLQSLILPLELKINSLLEAVRSLESKLDEKNAAPSVVKENKPKTLLGDRAIAGSKPSTSSSYAASVAGSRTPTTYRADPKPLYRPATRKQRAMAATSSANQVNSVSPSPADSITQRTVSQAASAAQQTQRSESQLAPSGGKSESVTIDIGDMRQNPGDVFSDPLEVNTLDAHQWRSVRGRHRKAPIRGAGEIDLQLATVEKMKYIHVWSLRNDVTAEQVQSYMARKCSSGAPYAVEKLQLKHTNYASFVLTVPESLFEFFMTATNWPPNTEFNEWFPFRRHSKRANGDNNRPSSQANS